MIKLEKEKKLMDMIRNELSEVIRCHGPIDNEWVFSASKRILGSIKAWIFNNNNIRERKRIRGFGLIQAGVTIYDKHGPVVIMAVAKNYAMMRKPGCIPFVEYYADIPKKYSWGRPPQENNA